MEAKVEKWYELDSGAFAALVAHPPGYFILPVKAKAWAWLPFDSDDWNAIDQRILRQGRATQLDGPPADAPPLPQPDPTPYKRDPDSVGRWAQDVDLLQWIEQASSKRRVVYLVLQEDPYETSFGDGLFRDPVACMADERAAHTYQLEGQLKRHVRRIELSLENGRLQAKGERHDYADRYTVYKALQLLTRHA